MKNVMTKKIYKHKHELRRENLESNAKIIHKIRLSEMSE